MMDEVSEIEGVMFYPPAHDLEPSLELKSFTIAARCSENKENKEGDVRPSERRQQLHQSFETDRMKTV